MSKYQVRFYYDGDGTGFEKKQYRTKKEALDAVLKEQETNGSFFTHEWDGIVAREHVPILDVSQNRAIHRLTPVSEKEYYTAKEISRAVWIKGKCHLFRMDAINI